MVNATLKGLIFDIQRYSIHDGPGIRTNIFFKGCPLKCIWCDNPESQKISPEVLYFKSICVKCYRCIESCFTGATRIGKDGEIYIERASCIACGKCCEVCGAGARKISGRFMTVEEVLNYVRRDALFYRVSGGGVTFTGGEATLQEKFFLELSRRCQENGFHTCLETSGYFQSDKLERLLRFIDLVLYDIKHMDSVRHRKLTFQGNEMILENLKRITEKRIPVIVRMPLIPGKNDSKKDLAKIGNFLRDLKINTIEVLPYHQMGARKYEALDREYPCRDIRAYRKHDMARIKKFLESSGPKVSVIT
jgi:pyruvate formate lyase activating enzyme